MSHAQLTLSGNNIGIDHGTAQLPEYSHDCALPRRDSTRESDQEHRALKQKERAENTPGHGCFVHAVHINVYTKQATSLSSVTRFQGGTETLLHIWHPLCWVSRLHGLKDSRVKRGFPRPCKFWLCGLSQL